jgi:hypothetical protein
MFVTLCLPVRRVGATGNDLPPTSSSFTVGAWMYPTSTGPTTVQTALSQDGTSISGFFLQNSDGHWRLCAPASQSTSSAIDCAIGPAVKIDTWVWSSVNGARSTSNCAST